MPSRSTFWLVFEPPEFADLYAQTLAYGLLAARWRTPGAFDRRIAAESIPATSGVLRDAFRYISLADPHPDVAWIVDEIVDLLAGAPVRAMLAAPARRHGRDPVLDFYETFLHCYDPELRRKRGVYYTPPELVSYVVRSVHRLLQTRLGRRDGLADGSVTLLDPAAGTMTFVVEAIRCAVEETRRTTGGGAVPALVGDHLLRDFHAFELMMAPYAIGHLKMSLILEELGGRSARASAPRSISPTRWRRTTWRSRPSPARRPCRGSPIWRGGSRRTRGSP